MFVSTMLLPLIIIVVLQWLPESTAEGIVGARRLFAFYGTYLELIWQSLKIRNTTRYMDGLCQRHYRGSS